MVMDSVKQNEVLLKHNSEWLYFSNPHRIIIATRLEDVPGALYEIEGLVEKRGWHAAGFISYEAAPAFDPAYLAYAGDEFPYLWFGLYPQPRSVSLPNPDVPQIKLHWQPMMDRVSYNTAIDRIKEEISQGNTYQVNY